MDNWYTRSYGTLWKQAGQQNNDHSDTRGDRTRSTIEEKEKKENRYVMRVSLSSGTVQIPEQLFKEFITSHAILSD